MIGLYRTKTARRFFHKHFNIPQDATVLRIEKDNIHFTHDFKTFKCRAWQVKIADFPVMQRLRALATLPLAFVTKGFAFLLLTDTTATNNKDGQLLVLAPTTNYGTADAMWASCDAGAQFHALIDFTLPSGSGTISAITLNLYKAANGGTNTGVNVEVHEMTRDWTESQATWNVYSTGNNWTSAGGDYSSTVVDSLAHTATNSIWRAWDLIGAGATNPISGLTWGSNVKLLLLISPESTTPQQAENYYTKERASNKPYIEITYTAGGGSTFVPRTSFFM
ncbi:MAG: DNRLRE domain-containing protein [Fibrobacteres bacterium]|nr:DNRLRE domain-containing protein [Fibrobacterota bacterium]